jgi:hypothetical protein
VSKWVLCQRPYANTGSSLGDSCRLTSVIGVSVSDSQQRSTSTLVQPASRMISNSLILIGVYFGQTNLVLSWRIFYSP